MTDYFELEEQTECFLKFLTLNRVDSFYPSALGKYLNTSSNQVLNLLQENSVIGRKLFLQWELRCPDCSRTLDVKFEKVLDSECFCNCGEEFEPTVSDFYPILKINPQYKDHLIRKQKKNSQIPLLNLQIAI